MNSEMDANRPAGPRILTFFLYLNNINEGGGMNFPGLCNGKSLPIFRRRGEPYYMAKCYEFQS